MKSLFKKSSRVHRVYVGSTDMYLSHAVAKQDSEAVLCNSTEFIKIKKHKASSNVFYTAIGDVSLDEAYELLGMATEIVYINPPIPWQDQESKTQTMELLNYYLDKVIEGSQDVDRHRLYFKQLLSVEESRTNASTHLFVAGCSVARGMFVEPQESFGHLIAQELGMPLVNLAHSGGSISWSADQILRSDIRAGDVVIWALSGIHRVTWLQTVHDRGIELLDSVFCNPSSDVKRYRNRIKDNNFETVQQLMTAGEQHQLLTAIKTIMQVKNFCNKIGAQLLFAPLPYSGKQNIATLRDVFSKVDDWVDIDCFDMDAPYWTDFGSDGKHPGPVSHGQIANAFIRVLVE
jgi:hypothetical protein